MAMAIGWMPWALLALTGTNGVVFPFPEPAAKRPTIVVFVSTVCPVSNDYHQRLIGLWREYGHRTNFLLVYPNKTETLDDVRRHAETMRLPFPVYRDSGNEIADRAGATVTPSAAIFATGSASAPAYYGPIDDAVNPARVKRRLLREAIREVLGGRRPRPWPAAPYG